MQKNFKRKKFLFIFWMSSVVAAILDFRLTQNLYKGLSKVTFHVCCQNDLEVSVCPMVATILDFRSTQKW